jgi:Flp pilus assembly pilin Flp
MRLFRRDLRRLRAANGGAAAIEYALLGAVVALGIVAALLSTKTNLNDLLSLINIRFGKVHTEMANGTRKVVSVTNGTSMLNNATLGTVTTVYDDGSKDVVFNNSDYTKVNFQTRTYSYGADGKIQNALFNYPGGGFDNDVYNHRQDGSFDITNTNGQGDTFIYNAKTTIVDGYSVYTKHMIQESRPLYQDSVTVSDISNPNNPVAVGYATRNPDGTISLSGTVDATKYLP